MNVYEWSADAAVGARVVYHRGTMGALAPSRRGPAFDAHKAGLVFLAQRRRADGLFDFEATRISRRTALLLGLLRAPGRTALGDLPQPRRWAS